MRITSSDNFNVGTIPFDQFEKTCSGFEIVGALSFLQRKSAEMCNQPIKEINLNNGPFGSGKMKISSEANACIAKHLLLNSSAIYNKVFKESDYLKAVFYFNHLKTDLDYLNSSNSEAQRWAIRAAYSQFHYQRIPAHLLGRYYIFFNEFVSKSASISKMVKEATGLEPWEIMVIGTSFYGTVLQNKLLDIRNLENHTIPEFSHILTSENIAKYLAMSSISQDMFRSECSQWELDNELLKKYEFNPLWLYPIIRTSVIAFNASYIAPSLNDLVYRCTEGIYYSAMEQYRQSGSANLFSAKFGLLFQEYVGYLLQDTRNQNQSLGSVEPETEYRYQGNKIRSADWMLIQQNTVVQIECKKFSTSNKFRAGIIDGSDDDFNATLNRFVNYVGNLYEKSIHIKKGMIPLLSKTVNNTFSVFVTLDDLYFIESRLKKEISLRAAQQIPAIIDDFKFHILGCTEFEVLCEFLKTHSDKNLIDLLRIKEEDQNYYVEFDEFLNKNFNFQCTEVSLTTKAFHKLWDSIGLGDISEFKEN